MYVIQGNGWIDLYHRTIIKDWKAPDMWAHYGLRANSAWGNDPMGYHEINLIFCKCQNRQQDVKLISPQVVLCRGGHLISETSPYSLFGL